MSISLAQLGLIHEFGNSHVPARPFLIPAFQEKRAELATFEAGLLRRVLRGQLSKRDALGKLGAKGQAIVQTKIRTGPFRELEESTKQRKMVAGKRSDQPLIDSRQMVNNVQWDWSNE